MTWATGTSEMQRRVRSAPPGRRATPDRSAAGGRPTPAQPRSTPGRVHADRSFISSIPAPRSGSAAASKTPARLRGRVGQHRLPVAGRLNAHRPRSQRSRSSRSAAGLRGHLRGEGVRPSCIVSSTVDRRRWSFIEPHEVDRSQSCETLQRSTRIDRNQISSAATNALSVSNPSDGGQSMNT